MRVAWRCSCSFTSYRVDQYEEHSWVHHRDRDAPLGEHALDLSGSADQPVSTGQKIVGPSHGRGSQMEGIMHAQRQLLEFLCEVQDLRALGHGFRTERQEVLNA